ncbi:placenta-specific gene 8 protein-like [Ptychodera flava]|uniref:placenta-specific gene 8 protein-like n=1 Tax=Ptychodera flava TaxID=63121 RepID=UPI003969D394
MAQVVTIQPKKRDWANKLFACQCKRAPCNCMTVTFCYPCYMSRIGTRIGENPCTPCCVPCSALPFRTKIRTMYNIKGSVTNDCCVTTFCCCCAACQMSREMDFLKEQGLA